MGLKDWTFVQRQADDIDVYVKNLTKLIVENARFIAGGVATGAKRGGKPNWQRLIEDLAQKAAQY